METPKLRIRLLFNNNILTKSQKKDGLRRSWLLLKPHQHHQTFSDVVSYILHLFDLFHSCPHGLILSMEGFVLPEFESTSILKDKDLISVKRKEIRLIDANEAIEEAKTSIEDEVVEKQPIVTHLKLLANEEVNEDAGGYQSETDKDEDEAQKTASRDRDLASKKRKASSKLEKSKKKRKRESVVITVQKKHLQHCEDITKPKKKCKRENRSNQNPLLCPGTVNKGAKDLEPEPNSGSELKQNKEDTVQAPGMSDRPKKASRSTRRKRIQRIIKRSLRDQDKNDEQSDKQPVKDMTANTGSKKDIAAQQSDDDSDADGDLVPVVVRPGLIRYKPSGQVKDVQEANGSDVHSTQNGSWEKFSAQKEVSDVGKEANGWNGITNKRKGQKWGQEKQPSSWDAINEPTSSWKNSIDANGHSSSTWGAKKYPPKRKPIDFNKLLPLLDLPKAGDIIAYRLLELSSSLCPELSSFRVGKITSFDPESNKIIVVPVPEYPLNLKKKACPEEVAEEQPLGFAVYNDDGSLETDFTSLNDVRILKLSDFTSSVGTKVPTSIGSFAPSTSKRLDEAQDVTIRVAPETSAQELHTNGPANGKKDAWEEIAEAITKKKALLKQEDRWNKKVTPAKRPWSFRSVRRGAIGPVMARLRDQNGV